MNIKKILDFYDGVDRVCILSFSKLDKYFLSGTPFFKIEITQEVSNEKATSLKPFAGRECYLHKYSEVITKLFNQSHLNYPDNLDPNSITCRMFRRVGVLSCYMIVLNDNSILSLQSYTKNSLNINKAEVLNLLELDD